MNGSKRDKWGETEDDMLIRKVAHYGKNWAKIATYIPGRSMDELYARYLTLKTFAERIIKNEERLKRIRYNDRSSIYSKEEPVHKKLKIESPPNSSYSHFCPTIKTDSYPPKLIQQVLQYEENQIIKDAREYKRSKEIEDNRKLVNIFEKQVAKNKPDLIEKSKQAISKINLFHPPDDIVHSVPSDSDSSTLSSSDSESEIIIPKKKIKIPKYREVSSIQVWEKSVRSEYGSCYLGGKYFEERNEINTKLFEREDNEKIIIKHTPKMNPIETETKIDRKKETEIEETEKPVIIRRKRGRKKKIVNENIVENSDSDNEVIKNKKTVIKSQPIIKKDDKLFENVLFCVSAFNALGKNKKIVKILNASKLIDMFSDSNEKNCCLCQKEGFNLQLCSICKRYYHSNCILCDAEAYDVRNKDKWKCFLCEPLYFKHIKSSIESYIKTNNENKNSDDDDDDSILVKKEYSSDKHTYINNKKVNSLRVWNGMKYTKSTVNINSLPEEMLDYFENEYNVKINNLICNYKKCINRIEYQQFYNMSELGMKLLSDIERNREYYHYDFREKKLFFNEPFPISSELWKLYKPSEDYYIHFCVLLQSLFKDLFTVITKIYSEVIVEEVKNEIDSKKEDKSLPDDGYGGSPRAWIFQVNPLVYDIDKSLQNLKEITWLTKQYRNNIHANDVVFIWKSGNSGGLVAMGTVKSEPCLMNENEKMIQYYNGQVFLFKTDYRCVIKIDIVLPSCVSKNIFMDDDMLNDLLLFKNSRDTNFRLTAVQANCILGIIRKNYFVEFKSDYEIRSTKDITPLLTVISRNVSSYMLDIQDYCHICGKYDDDPHIVLCDKCNRGFHTKCLNPVLSRIPNNEWICLICKKKSENMYVRGENCEICGEESNDPLNCKSCKICHKLYHVHCYRASTNFNLPEWKCIFCEGYEKSKYHLVKEDEWCRVCKSKSPEDDLFRCSCCDVVRHKFCPDPFNSLRGYKKYDKYLFCYRCYNEYVKSTLFDMNTQIHIFHQEACSLVYKVLMKNIEQIVESVSSITDVDYVNDAISYESTRVNMIHKLITYVLTNYIMSIKE